MTASTAIPGAMPASTDGSARFAVCLLCGVGPLVCALPIEHVVEIMRPLPVQHVGDVPPFVLGISIVRGAPCPVVDAALLLGLARAEQTPGGPLAPAGPSGRFVTVRAGEHGRRLSLAVDEVRGVRPLERRELDQLPPLLQAVDARGAAAIGALDGELLVVLQAARSIPEAAWSRVTTGGSGA